MHRKKIIFLLTHGYPTFVVLHMVFGNWSRASQAIFNVMPLFIFGGLLRTWVKSRFQLDNQEKIWINYLIFMLLSISIYYNICVFSTPGWVYSHNLQMASFILLTVAFYLYVYYEG